MERQILSSRVIKTDLIKWKELQFIQQEDFKEWIGEGDQKLYNSLLQYQFIDPFKIWQSDGVMYCLDGKHRYTDLLKIEDAGIKVPDLLPATFIDCGSKKEAAELVLIYSSRYARITEHGLHSFLQEFDLSIPELCPTTEIPEFDIKKFLGDIDRDFSLNNKELEIDSFQDEVVLKLTFNREEYIEVKHRINELLGSKGLTKPEELIKEMLFA